MLSGVELWWIFLSIVSLTNISLWTYSLLILVRRKARFPADVYRGRLLIIWLSCGYVYGCAFRSFLPRIDVERICLVDSWLSSMLVGRSVATIAELCFITQCALLLHEAGKRVDDRLSIIISLLLVPVIVIAEGFSWYATISTHYFGSVVEESLWTIAGMMLVASFFSLWPCVSGRHRDFLGIMILFSLGFIFFMVTVDVPMYWQRWQQDAVSGLEYLSFVQGIQDVSGDCIVSFEWQDWRQEVPWMTLYFTVAVWLSIYLAHAPVLTVKGRGCR
jgi:hypothetical protein